MAKHRQVRQKLYFFFLSSASTSCNLKINHLIDPICLVILILLNTLKNLNICFVAAESDTEQKNATHLSNQEENENTQEVIEDSMENKDMENSAAEI